MIRWLDTQPTWRIILASFLMLLLGWQLVVMIGEYPVFILPGPTAVAQALYTLLTDGTLLNHARQTLSEVLMGLFIGCLIALPLGYFTRQITPGRAVGIALSHRLTSHSRHCYCPLAVHLDTVHLLAAGISGCACRLLSHSH